MQRQLTKEDRKAIEYYLQCNWSYVRIGELLQKDRGSIRREVERNTYTDRIYHYGAAHKRYLARRKAAKRPQCKSKNDRALQRKVITRLKKLDSPEQIAGRLKTKGIILSHETIYQ